MKQFIKLSIALLLVLTVGVYQLSAQKNIAARSQQVVSKLTEKLALTTEQQQKVSALFVEHINNMKSIREEAKTLGMEQAKSKMKELRKNTNDKLNAILTDEQKMKYAALKNEKLKSIQKRKGENKKQNLEKPTENELEKHLEESVF